MCGIYGMVSLTGEPLARSGLAPAMGLALRHRGPDGEGEHREPRAILASRRLRIVDLHARADQPFSDPSRRLHVVCNGEIYNAGDLRRRYPDFPARSRSDVEQLLPLFLDLGEGAFEEIDGMFAVALWDSRSETLLLARDRAGEKPLFYAVVEGELWFASEPQAILVHPALSRDVDTQAVGELLELGYVLEPRTLHREIRRVPSGSVLRVSGGEISIRSYWSPVPPNRYEDRREVLDLLAAQIDAAVEKQLVADVPIGIFASGGLDSSLLAALASDKLGPDRLRLYSVAFPEHSYDESSWARRLAADLGSRHATVMADGTALTEALRTITEEVAEPIADPAVLPTYLLARRAVEDVKVVVSGEGADELFGGYPTYLGHRLAGGYGRLPAPLRRLVRAGIDRLPVSEGKMPLEYLLKRFVQAAEEPPETRHLRWFGTGLPAEPTCYASAARDELQRALTEAGDPLNGLMLFDYRSYLRDNLLVKIDRATMRVSLESRTPFLDRDLTRLAFAVPSRLKLRHLSSKWVLKEVAARRLPRAVVYRRKRGLSVPVSGWINHGLRGEVDRLLDPAHLERQGLLPVDEITRRLAEHRAGHANHTRLLWPAFILQLWLERWS